VGIGALPAAGKVQFGAVRLPPGRRIGFADARILVTRPPRTQRAAEPAAAEIRTLGREFWPIERPAPR
jgi:hypothetical protein